MGQRLKAKTIKLLEDYIGVNLSDLRLDNGFLDMIQKAPSTKEKKNRISLKAKTFVLPRTSPRIEMYRRVR